MRWRETGLSSNKCDRDERAAADDSFRSDGGGLCVSGAGEEGAEVSEFTESFWGNEVKVYRPDRFYRDEGRLDFYEWTNDLLN